MGLLMFLFIKKILSIVMNQVSAAQRKRKRIKFKMHFEVFHNILDLLFTCKAEFAINYSPRSRCFPKLLFYLPSTPPLPKQRHQSPDKWSTFSIIFSHCWSICKDKRCSLCFALGKEAMALGGCSRQLIPRPFQAMPGSLHRCKHLGW